MDAATREAAALAAPTFAMPGYSELLQAERSLLEKIVRDSPLENVLTEMADTMERLLPDVLVSVLVADTDGRHLRHGAAPSLPDFYNEAIDGIAIGEGVGSCGTAAYRRRPAIAVDIATNPWWTDFRDLASQVGVAACWSTPVLTAKGVLLGTFAMYHRVPRTPRDSDLELSAALARTAGLAIERHRIRRARAAAEARERAALNDLGFILDASTEFGRNLDQQHILRRLAELVVPRLAPMCIVDVRESGRIHRVATAATNLEAQQYLIDYVHDAVDRVLNTDLTEVRAASAGDGNAWRMFGVIGHVCIPLSERGRPFGALTLLATAQHPIDAHTIALAEELARRAAVSARHAQQYTDRVLLAHDLQAGLLLPELPTPPGAELAASYSPAGEGLEVGGDFYDVFSLPDGRWAFIIGDVCGRGARAATATGLVRYTARAAARLLNDPMAVVDAINAALLERPGEQNAGFVTLVFGQFRQVADGLAVEVIRAGHLPPLVRRSDHTVEEIYRPGKGLGICTDLDLASSHVTLRRGDSLVLVTDGVTEARNGDGDLFGEQRLVQALADVRSSDVTPDLLIEAIGGAVADFRGDQCDDSDDCATLIMTAI